MRGKRTSSRPINQPGRRAVLLALAIVGAMLPVIGAPPLPARAGLVTFTVTKTTDTNDGACTRRDCSLREAILAANALADAEIAFPAGTLRLSIAGRDEDQGATGDLDIRAGMTIRRALAMSIRRLERRQPERL